MPANGKVREEAVYMLLFQQIRAASLCFKEDRNPFFITGGRPLAVVPDFQLFPDFLQIMHLRA